MDQAPCRPLSATQAVQLSSLARLTHPRHFNHHVYNFDEIYIPGGLVLGLVNSASARDLHEVGQSVCAQTDGRTYERTESIERVLPPPLSSVFSLLPVRSFVRPG